jgi:hypothetical protein
VIDGVPATASSASTLAWGRRAKFGLSKTTSCTIVRARAKIGLQNLAYNLVTLERIATA